MGTKSMERIGPTLDALREVWVANPHLRLGQLVTNAAACRGSVNAFYIEDDDLRVALEGMLGEGDP